MDLVAPVDKGGVRMGSGLRLLRRHDQKRITCRLLNISSTNFWTHQSSESTTAEMKVQQQ